MRIRTAKGAERLLAGVGVVIATLAAQPALADERADVQVAQREVAQREVAQLAPDAEPALLPVRVALSETAAKRLFALRVRRLLSVELDGEAEVEAMATGPLGGDIIRVWIDAPTPRIATIEVRRGTRAVAKRALAIADFPADVAARVVTIATAEMVRVQARLGDPTINDGPTDDGTDGPGAGDGFAVDASFGTALLPSSDPLLIVGPAFGLEHRTGITTQGLHVRLMGGEGDRQRLRWLEFGGSLGLRWGIGDRLRLGAGAAATAVVLDLPKASLVDGQTGDGAEWSARATAVLRGELAVARSTWLTLTLQPGGLVRSMTLQDDLGQTSTLGGFVMGIDLGLVIAPM